MTEVCYLIKVSFLYMQTNHIIFTINVKKKLFLLIF
jgi:hypothetical protein